MEEKTFYEEETELVLDAFRTFDFRKTASWSEIELWATVNSVEIDFKFVCTFLAGTRIFDSLFESFVSCLKENRFLDGFANTVEFAECLFRVYEEKKFDMPPPVKAFEKWASETDMPCLDISHFPEWNSCRKKKYVFLDLLDAKFPYLLAKFYERRKRDLHRFDAEFVRWLSARYKAKAAAGGTLKAVSDALEAEMAAQRKTEMFMQ